MATVLRQSTQIIVRVGPFMDATDGVTPETGVTLAAADQAEALKAAGAATVDISGNTFAAVTGAGGWYDLTLTTTDTNTVGDLTIVIQDTSVCLPVFARFQVIEEAAYDQLYAASAPGAATPTAVANVQTDVDDIQGRLPAALVSGRIDASVGAMAANVLTATAINADAFTASKFAADVTTEFQAGLATSSELNGVGSEVNDLSGVVEHLHRAVVLKQLAVATGSTSTEIRTAATQADDFYNGAMIIVQDLATGGAVRRVVDYAQTNGAFTVSPALPFTPTVTDPVYVVGRIAPSIAGEAMDLITDAVDSNSVATSAVTEIQSGLATSAALALVQADTDDIQTRLPVALVGGRMDSSVGAMAANVITSAATDATFIAEINAEIDTALADIRLDELIQNAAAPVTPTINSFWDRITSKDGSQTYDRATDSLEAIKDSIGGGGLTQQQVRDAMKLAPTAGAPAAGSIDEHLDDILADTNDLQTRLPTTLVGGRMRSHVEAMDAGVITAAVIATDAVDSDAIAANAVTEIQAGLATSAALATVQADTDDIQTRLPAALVGGRMDSSVGAMAANVITAGALDSGAVDEIVDQNWNEVLAGHLVAGSTGAALNDAAAGGAGLTQQQVADALKLAPAAGAPAAGSVYSELDTIMGPGFNSTTDSLEEIRDAIDAIPGGGPGGSDIINVEGI